ncbi:MAG TPA: crotonase/enoyl-CoA hydratase family protein [Polyangiaceae bacterium]|jgi:enoyl-CoA hydratase/carnithine racemase|nr:crotonase/enoyl-CoA hydratase family protein [Polyangiaceae bacterium]
MADFVLFEQDDAVVTLTLNRPEERNALSTQAQWDEIVDCCARVRADESVKVLILTGAGTAFSAGGNVKDMRDKKGIAGGNPYDVFKGYQGGIQRIPLALFELDVPTIAAVNGPAIGAGCDLACMCDLRIASDQAKFAESFVKLGIIPGDGGAWLLQRAIGYQRAAELTFTGDAIDAQTALAMGLVTRVVAPEALLPTARDLAARIAANSGPALRMAKQLLRQAQTARLDETLRLSAALQALAHHTPEHDAAVAAFFAKRP